MGPPNQPLTLFLDLSLLHSLFLVFEYCEHDMGRLLDSMARPFTLPEVKCLAKQVRASRWGVGGWEGTTPSQAIVRFSGCAGTAWLLGWHDVHAPSRLVSLVPFAAAAGGCGLSPFQVSRTCCLTPLSSPTPLALALFALLLRA